MAYSYAQLQNIKDRIVRDLSNQQSSLETAKGQFGAISSNLAAMQAEYTTWAVEVNAMATANPNDDAIQALKAERDLLVSEFQSTKDEADALDAAVNS